jgi:hypothetical protein
MVCVIFFIKICKIGHCWKVFFYELITIFQDIALV